MCLFADCTFNETQKNCSCRSGYTWSEDICKNHACCKDRPCSLKPEETAVCLSDKRGRAVLIWAQDFLMKETVTECCDFLFFSSKHQWKYYNDRV